EIINNNDYHDDHHGDQPTLLLRSQPERMRPLLLARDAFGGECPPSSFHKLKNWCHIV
nr:pheromonostatic peptide 1, PSP-1 [Helicoverpa zea=corn earworm moths, accessory glands and duplexes, seminal fluid, Peptide, 57 aa] [Helicoverpa zea]